jgi:LysM repeat protein
LIISSLSSYAQSDSLEVHTINGKEYYIHIIEKGESLYSLHKKYNVPLEVINKENPSVLDGLSIGEKIFIPLKKDIEVEVKTNGNYINHEVTKQQTLYSIANLYKVNQQEIIAANPEISEGLKEGQTIRIPVNQLKQNDLNQVNLSNDTLQYKTHVVKKGETLYSLTKLYDVSSDSIKMVNNGLTQGLREGETIYIPKKIVVKNNFPILTSLNDADTITIVKKSEYKIGLLLPFYLDENDEIVENRNALEEKMVYPKSKFAIEFYKGLLYALDSISTDNNKFKVYVYDTKGNDTTRIKTLLLKPEFKSFDLIIGPLYYDNFKHAVEFAQKNKIPIVSPVKQNNKTLLGNDYVFKSIPSQTSIIDPLTTILVDSFKTDNLMAIEHEKSKEKLLVESYVSSYNKKILGKDDTAIYSAIKTLKITNSFADVVGNLKRDKNNVIFMPTSSQTFVTGLFNYLTTTLNKREYQDYKITLIGLEDWMKFENIDLEYFQTLNVHFCAPQYIDEQDTLTAHFIKKYVKETEIYPSNNTFLGFDLGCYFGGNLLTYGNLFTSQALVKYNGFSIKLNFFKTGVESGYENIDSHLLRFEDYTLKKVN